MATLEEPKIPPTTNLALPFLNAFFASTEINRRSKALQEQMLKMQMQNDFQQQRLNIMADNAEALRISRGVEDSYRNLKMGMIEKGAEDQVRVTNNMRDFMSTVENSKNSPGTPGYWNDVTTAWNKYPELQRDKQAQAMLDGLRNNHKVAAKGLADAGANVTGAYFKLKNAVLGDPKATFDPTKWAPEDPKYGGNPDISYRIYDTVNKTTLDPHSKTAEKVNAKGSGLQYQRRPTKDIKELGRLQQNLPDVLKGITGNPDFAAASEAKADEAAAVSTDPAQIKADFQAGKITKDQAVSQLRDLGFQ